jgi:LEA14-like dessication related protein
MYVYLHFFWCPLWGKNMSDLPEAKLTLGTQKEETAVECNRVLQKSQARFFMQQPEWVDIVCCTQCIYTCTVTDNTLTRTQGTPMSQPENLRIVRQFLGLAAFFFLALSLYGCAGFGKRLEPPKINLANVTVQEIKAFETVFGLQLRVFNNNDVPLVIKALDCDLEVNGSRLASGVTETESTIPAFGTGLVDVTVYASSVQIVNRLLQGLRDSKGDGKTKSIDYDLSGHLHLGGSALPAKIPFSTQGSMALDRFFDSQNDAL